MADPGLFDCWWRDVLVCVCVFLSALLSAAAGTGGGPVYVAAFVLLGGIRVHTAVPLSYVSIFAGTMVAFVLQIGKKNPDPRIPKPLIDFDVLVLFEPLAIGGTVVGVVLNLLMPDWIIFVFFFSVLFLAFLKSTSKGIKMFRREGRAHAKARLMAADSSETRAEVSEEAEEDWPLLGEVDEISLDSEALGSGEDDFEASLPLTINDPLAASPVQEPESGSYLSHLHKKESRIPFGKLFGLVGLEAAVALISFCLSGSSSVLYVESCSVQHWIILLFIPVFCILFSVIFALRIQWNDSKKEKCGYEWEVDEFRVSYSNLLGVFSMGFLAGLIAGFLGVGGGMVKTPLLLQLGLKPSAIAATVQTAILLTATSSCIQFYFHGSLKILDSLFYAFFAFLGFLIGKLAIARVLKRTGRQSLILFVLSFVMLASFLAVLCTTVLRLKKDLKDGLWNFGSVC